MDSTTASMFLPKKFTPSWIPEGYVLLVGPDDEKYLVPDFMVDSIDQDYHSIVKKKELKAYSAPGTVSHILLLRGQDVRHRCLAQVSSRDVRKCPAWDIWDLWPLIDDANYTVGFQKHQ